MYSSHVCNFFDLEYKSRLNTNEESKQRIGDFLDAVENKHDVRIIYAVETGAREWHAESRNENYAIRFVYVQRNRRKYVSLRDNEEATAAEINGGFTLASLCQYDWQGYDITRALTFLSQMNVNLVEMVYASYVYRHDEQNMLLNRVRQLLAKQRHLQLPRLVRQYRARLKFFRADHNDTTLSMRNYFYAIRNAAMVEWLALKYFAATTAANNHSNTSTSSTKQTAKLIETDFRTLVADVRHRLGDEVYAAVVELTERKRHMTQYEMVARVPCVDKWINRVFDESAASITTAGSVSEELLAKYDKILHSILKIRFDDD